MKRTFLVAATVGLAIAGTALICLRNCNYFAAPPKSAVEGRESRAAVQAGNRCRPAQRHAAYHR